ncbi:MAG TPA: hypothetical protein VM925_03485 [Labilithrix sp.]|nr:hypothetical protein [Labilithrix sp.]
MKERALAVASTLLFLLAACSSESEIGEACDRPGGTVDFCEGGLVCGKPADSSSALVCIPICLDDKDCPNDADCKGVEGTNLKGCRFKD